MTFYVQKAEPGDYTVDINGTSGSFTVSAPPPAAVAEVTVTPQANPVVPMSAESATPTSPATSEAAKTTGNSYLVPTIIGVAAFVGIILGVMTFRRRPKHS